MNDIKLYKTAIILGFGFGVGNELCQILRDFIYNIAGWPLG